MYSIAFRNLLAVALQTCTNESSLIIARIFTWQYASLVNSHSLLSKQKGINHYRSCEEKRAKTNSFCNHEGGKVVEPAKCTANNSVKVTSKNILSIPLAIPGTIWAIWGQRI